MKRAFFSAVIASAVLAASAGAAFATTITDPCNIPASARHALWPVVASHLHVIRAPSSHLDLVCNTYELRDVIHGHTVGCVKGVYGYQQYFVYVATDAAKQACILNLELAHLPPNYYYGPGSSWNGGPPKWKP